MYGKRMKTEIKQFFQDMKATDDCILWPFNKTQGGYPKVTIDSQSKLLHRVICEKENGPPPSPKHHAAHSCGNSSCINKRHLSWKTPKENSKDKIRHGTALRGEQVYNASMSDALAARIKQDTRKNRVIANDFGVREDIVSNIKRNKSYVHV